MDLTSLNLTEASQAGASVELRHPGTGQPIGVTLSVIGYESEPVEKAGRDFARSMSRGKDKPDVAEMVRARRLVLAKAAVVGVEGGSGKSETVEDIRRLMDQPGYVWIVEQVEAVAGDRAAFFPSAEAS